MPKQEKFDFLDAMKDDGVRFDEYGGMQDPRFYYRIVNNVVHAGVRKHFDRWANSVDFAFPIPKTRRAYRKVIEKLDRAYQSQQYNPKYAETRWL